MKEKILKCFYQYKSLTIQEIEQHCKPKTSKDFTDMIKILNQLEEEKIIFNNHNTYTYIDPDQYMVGVAKDVSKFEILVSNADEKVRVDKRNARSVFDRDEVLVECKAHQNKIIHVFSHGIRRITGSFYKKKKDLVFFSDLDFHRPIIIKNIKEFKIHHRDKAVLEIIKYENPLICKVVEVLGPENEPGVDITSMLYEKNVRIIFPKQINKELARIKNYVTFEELDGRYDYRDLLTITIDGDDARDFDDAISIEKRDSGYILYVHIADVSHYVKKNSALDKEAYLRSTSIYLADRVVPMLPLALSNGICSLNPNVDRLTLTCKMYIDQEGHCTSYKLEPSVIHSDVRCTYRKVNAFLDGDEEAKRDYREIGSMLENLKMCCLKLQERSMERGTIDFNTKEAKVHLNKKGRPVDITLRERGFSEQMIEECMILANVCVANYLNIHSLPCMYRVHEEPDPKKIMTLCTVAQTLGQEISFNLADVCTKDIQLFLNSIEEDANKDILSIVALRAMQKARYDASCLGHYGLALDEYCHFTSPIRRYSDLVVHRMLHKYVFEQSMANPKVDMESIQEQSYHVSEKERDAIAIERQVDDYEKALYMSKRIGQKFIGTIVGVQSFGFFVELENTVEGLVPIRSLYHDFFEYDEDTLSLVGETFKERYTIGQKVKVTCMEADTVKGQITFALS